MSQFGGLEESKLTAEQWPSVIGRFGDVGKPYLKQGTCLGTFRQLNYVKLWLASIEKSLGSVCSEDWAAGPYGLLMAGSKSKRGSRCVEE